MSRHPCGEVGHVWLLVPLALAAVLLAGALSNLIGAVP